VGGGWGGGGGGGGVVGSCTWRVKRKKRTCKETSNGGVKEMDKRYSIRGPQRAQVKERVAW